VASKVDYKNNMSQAEVIRNALAKVESLRQAEHASPRLGTMVRGLKSLQSKRFKGTYADLAADPRFGPATQFFLEELYGDKDFANRDAQFFKIAGALQRTLPRQAIETALMLAELHALSEDLDHAMAAVLLDFSTNNHAAIAVSAYVRAWRLVGRREDRMKQLNMVLTLGRDLVRLTKTRGLRLILTMMHAPANAAGFGALQHFLEAGFDTFATMNAHATRAGEFLSTIERRESELIRLLFDDELIGCQAELSRQLANQA